MSDATAILKKTMPYVLRHKWLVIFTLILTFLGAGIAQVNAVVLNFTVDKVNVLVQTGKNMTQGLGVILMVSAILLGKELVSVFTTYGQRFCGEKIKINISQELSRDIIVRMLTYRMAFFTREGNEAGRLQSRIDRGVESLSRLVQNLFIDLLPLVLSAILALILMFAQNVWVGTAAIIIVPIYFYVSFRQAVKLKGRRSQMMQYREKRSQGIINIIESINVIKSFNREADEGRKHLDLLTDIRTNQLKTRHTGYVFDGLKTFVEQIGVVVIIILTIYLVLSGQILIGAIMYHIMLFGNVTSPIRQLNRIYDDMNESLIYSGGFYDIIENANEDTEQTGTYRPDHIKGDFCIENVSFTYPNGTQALHNINMSIDSGKETALVGLSGAGKSTIINLLDKFYLPSSGRITLDGVDLRDWDTQYLRENIGLVLQKNHIFEGTIEENIRYGNPTATHDDVIEAARRAFLLEQIQQMPRGFDTKATELSGGQQQRVAIARMFVKDPAIIFLDEPTASLDAVATEQIKNSIDAIKANRTVIIISHSLSQIIDADYIYSLKNGRVMEYGTHEQCYAMGGTYRDIFDASARSLNIGKIAKTLEGESHD